MKATKASAARIWPHVMTLLEKAYAPGVLPLTLGALVLIGLYFIVISFT